jgi:di/tricarboxylate transporter
MTLDQAIVFGVLLAALPLFVWGRWRYDLIAVLALLVLVVFGVVPAAEAFRGFGHPAVITVAAVLIVSRALRNAGVVDFLVRGVGRFSGRPTLHLVALTFVAALVSAFINNVGALALLMPVALEGARKENRSPALVLMPLSFACILGGMTTMIGTPPNLIIATYRAEVTGAQFALFDFAPVGGVVAFVGVLFVALVGWRFLPASRRGKASPEDLFRIDGYIMEVRVPKDSDWVGRRIVELEELGDGDVAVAGLIRDDSTRLAPSRTVKLRGGDVVILRADPTELPSVVDKARLEMVGEAGRDPEILRSEDVALAEAVVPPGSSLVGRTPRSLRARIPGEIHLLAIARAGSPIRRRLNQVIFQAGDVLLLQGAADGLDDSVGRVGLLPLAGRRLQIGKRRNAVIAVAIFAAGLASMAVGILPAAVALTAVAFVLTVIDYVSVRDIYDSIDWPVIVLLAAMLPVGNALQATGGTELLVDAVLSGAGNVSAPLVLAVVIIVTMTLSDVINNAATAVVMAPISVTLAAQLGVAADPFLMAVAIGASCAFLTPIGHQCNTLVLGPGGYRFGDYWKMGLPLEIIIVVISVPLILRFWPL